MLIDLDEPGCLAPDLVGAKAARLARARAAGLPVLPGFVVPVAAGAQALAAGLAVLEREGRHAAHLAVMSAGIPSPLADELRARAATLPAPLVVRSSSALEGDLRWSGAFTSYLGVTGEHLPVAVAGCWASALGRDALERRQELDRPPEELALAVLVQPEVAPERAGTATLEPGGAVRVVSAAGAPAQLLAGWDPAEVATVPPGAADGETTLAAVAALVRAVHATLGDDTIEWALHDGQVVLLQSGASQPADPPAAPRPQPAAGRAERLPPAALGVARLAHRYGGACGDALVLPWALALPGVPVAEPSRRGDLAAAWRRARELAAELTGVAWRQPPGVAAACAAETIADLRGTGSPGGWRRALRRICELAPVDPGRARTALSLLEQVAAGLAAAGRLPSPAALWSLPPAQVTALLDGAAPVPPGPAAAGRLGSAWDPFVHAAVLAHGRQARGAPAAPGTAAGVAVPAGHPDHREPGGTRARKVLVAERPLPQFAPLLWHAAGLVTTGGSPAAHLVQVARSLHVPAVVACPMPTIPRGSGPLLIALDGDTGQVATTRATP